MSLFPRKMMCYVHSEVCFSKLLAILLKLWGAVLFKSEEMAVGCCTKAKLSVKWLHLTRMAMTESCSATGDSVEELTKTSPSKGSHCELFNHL